VLVAAAASVAADALVVALVDGVEDADALGEPVGEVDELAVCDAPVVGDAGPPPAVVEAVVLGAVVRGVVVRVVAFGAAVVRSGSLVAFGGAGSLVFGGAGGAIRGCCPEPKRNPTTVPGAGS